MLLERDRVLGDNRVRREARALVGAGHEVVLLHRGPRDSEPAVAADGSRLRTVLPRRPRARRAVAALPGPARRAAVLGCFAWRAARSGAGAVHAHDSTTLAPAWLAARALRAPLVYDTHEYAQGVPYHSAAARRFVRALERLVVPRCAAVITVSEATAERLQADHGLAQRPVVVRNVPDLDDGEGDRHGGEVLDLRRRIGVAPSDPLVLHQGALAPTRGCLELIDAVALAPRLQLLFLGDPDPPGYERAVLEHAARRGIADRVHVVPGVPAERLLEHTRQADAGVSLLNPNWLNHRFTLPNKGFEYVAAGLPVVATRGTALGDLVERLGVGTTTPYGDAPALARALEAAVATAGTAEMQARLAAARSELDWAREKQRLLDVYATLARGSSTRA